MLTPLPLCPPLWPILARLQPADHAAPRAAGVHVAQGVGGVGQQQAERCAHGGEGGGKGLRVCRGSERCGSCTVSLDRHFAVGLQHTIHTHSQRPMGTNMAMLAVADRPTDMCPRMPACVCTKRAFITNITPAHAIPNPLLPI